MLIRRICLGMLAAALAAAAHAQERLSAPYDGFRGAPPSRAQAERAQAARCIESMLTDKSGRCEEAGGIPKDFGAARGRLLAAGQRTPIMAVSGNDVQRRSEEARVLYLEHEDESKSTGVNE